jgi:hypothetical protein
MKVLTVVVVVLVILLLLVLAMSVRIVKQYENGVLFRLGRVIGERQPGLQLIIAFVDVLHRISLRIVTMPGLGGSISGLILCDATIRQHTTAGVPFRTVLADAGILAGIKVNLGAHPLAGHADETVTEGLDGLRERLADYAGLGAQIAKWRAVFTIRPRTAEPGLRGAGLCQEAGSVPIVEPEVLMAGAHDLARCGEVTEDVLRAVFDQLQRQGVGPEGLLLKPNMGLPGSTCSTQPSVQAVADATLTCLRRAVPAAVPGVVFLSGGSPVNSPRPGWPRSIPAGAQRCRGQSRSPSAERPSNLPSPSGAARRPTGRRHNGRCGTGRPPIGSLAAAITRRRGPVHA